MVDLYLSLLDDVYWKSSRINTTLAVNGLTPLLIARLDHQDAIARLNLLKLIKAVYEHHPRPKQLIVENDLPQKLKNLIEERRDGQSSGGQVLVKQMATSLLKALHINTVLVIVLMGQCVAVQVMHIQDATGHEFVTHSGNVFTIGKGNKPWVSLPNRKGIKLSIIEEARKRLAATQTVG
ncbi:hypothetical protein GH714_030314 [Hevea brasiliensis]|uniref:Small ribosomal subunit protein eS4 C-terminal domain-containing protein n=1 Tax=Hevea brasiliensis TaxID=3981 RepID=A0A6A6N9B6_HEVBR|nr:hypothetical protein GH714_030314 [Hevea brasiliensis]